MASSDQSRPPTALKPETPSPSLSSADTRVTTPSPSNEFFDDVFGSSPPGAGLGLGSNPHASATDADDGGAHATNATGTQPASEAPHRESSDVARLRSIHTSAGYREGLSAAKEAALQPGFDEGYALGAALGMRAGLVVSLAEMLAGAVDEGGDGDGAVASKLEAVARQCYRELQRAELLADEYIDVDGLWKWPTPAGANIHEVVALHPLVYRWQRRVDSYCEALGISAARLERRWVDEPDTTAPASARNAHVPSNAASTDRAVTKGQIFDF